MNPVLVMGAEWLQPSAIGTSVLCPEDDRRIHKMMKRFKVGDHVRWNSESGRVGARLSPSISNACVDVLVDIGRFRSRDLTGRSTRTRSPAIGRRVRTGKFIASGGCFCAPLAAMSGHCRQSCASPRNYVPTERESVRQQRAEGQYESETYRAFSGITGTPRKKTRIGHSPVASGRPERSRHAAGAATDH
jgi:hypothetical protein